MSGWEWLSSSLSEEPELFGEFNQCLAFSSTLQGVTVGPPNPTGSVPFPPKRFTFDSEKDVYSFLGDTDKSNMCILAFTNRTNERNGKLPLPVSRTLFQHTMQVFDLPASFLTALNAGLAIYADTVPASGTEDVSTCESIQYVIQQNGAYSAFSIAMNHNVRTLKTRVLILGVESSTLLDLFEYVESMLPRIHGPMLIPTIAMELQAHSLSMTIKTCRRHIHAIETTTGMRQFNYPHEKRGDNASDWKNLDLISITRELSSFLARFAFIKMQAETGRHLVQQMIRSTNLLIVDNDQRELVYKLQHIDNWFLGVAANCGYLSERATAQSQTVYCLIASQDSSTNIEIAQSSREIAEQSHKENGAMRSLAELGRQDNELMIQIARDSRAVALAAAQDSAAMQVIAAVTMLFLPATFTATFFSMTFFNFSDTEKPRVSAWAWMYVVVTVVLTIVVQLAWGVMSRRKSSKITQTTTTEL